MTLTLKLPPVGVIHPVREFIGIPQSLITVCGDLHSQTSSPPFFFLKELHSAFLNCGKDPDAWRCY